MLISGSGTNLQAVIDQVKTGNLDAEIAIVISSRADAYGLERARLNHIPAVAVIRDEFDSDDRFNLAILEQLKKSKVDLVVLAGYMRLVGKAILEAYPQKVINLHPALLPAFPGAHAIRDALEYGVKITGVTVHFADAAYDTGPIILQEFVPVHQDDTEATLTDRIHRVEHQLLPRAIKLLIEGRVKVEDRKVRILGKRGRLSLRNVSNNERIDYEPVKDG